MCAAGAVYAPVCAAVIELSFYWTAQRCAANIEQVFDGLHGSGEVVRLCVLALVGGVGGVLSKAKLHKCSGRADGFGREEKYPFLVVRRGGE